MAAKAITPYANAARGIAQPRMWPHEFVRLPPSRRTVAPTTGNNSSSHARRCTPVAGSVVSAAAGLASVPAREPVTAYPPRPLLPTPVGSGSVLKQVGVV